MSKSRAKPKAKGASRASGTRKPASKATPKAAKPASAGTKAQAPAKTGAKAASAANAPSGAKTSSAAKASAKSTPAAKDWRGQTLDRMRALIRAADPEMVEEVKWRKPSNSMAGVPVWSHHGIVCTGETYKNVVKLTFAHGAKLPDPSRVFNSSLAGNTRRAIDIHEGETLDVSAFKALVQAAVAHNSPPAKQAKQTNAGTPAKNTSPPAKAGPQAKQTTAPVNAAGAPTAAKVVLLSGGNPQIAKADGDAPVQAYIAAMPGWKSSLGQRLDAIITRTVPAVRKAVKWNSPFYGIEGQGWFLSFHVLTRYVKVTFFAGLSLRPVPPGGTPKSKEARWIDIYEDDIFDEAQMAKWVKQAAAIPGWIP